MTTTHDEPESTLGALESVARRQRHSTFIHREEIRDLHVKLALLSQKLDAVLEERSRVDQLVSRVHSLELFKAQMQVWGFVGGGLWSLALTLISLKVWS